MPHELEECISSLGEKKFRARQIFEWLHVKKVTDFDQMTNLSVQFRDILKQKFCLKSLFICKRLESNSDNTVKYLYELEDGNHIEAVLMEETPKKAEGFILHGGLNDYNEFGKEPVLYEKPLDVQLTQRGVKFVVPACSVVTVRVY